MSIEAQNQNLSQYIVRGSSLDTWQIFFIQEIAVVL